MTIAELLALLGRAWSRLLIYPAGLAAFTVVMLSEWLLARFVRRAAEPDPPPAPDRDGWWPEDGVSAGEALAALSGLAAPWLALALLPLPYAAGFDRQVDLFVALTLLEWPRLVVVWRDLRGGGAAQERGARRLAAVLNGYPPLILAALVLAQGAGSLELVAFAAAPQPSAAALTRLLYWCGATALLLTLPALLEVGPFAIDRRPPLAAALWRRPLLMAMRLRALGFVLITSLPWLELLPPAQEDGTPAPWLAPLPPLVIAALVWGFGRLTNGRRARPWAWGYLLLSAALLALLSYAAAVGLRERLS